MSGPTPASDVHGRTHTRGARDGCSEGERSPRRPTAGAESAPVLARHESLHLAILRATDPNHERRFSSMEELADQLTGYCTRSSPPNAGRCCRDDRHCSVRSAPSSAPVATCPWTRNTSSLPSPVPSSTRPTRCRPARDDERYAGRPAGAGSRTGRDRRRQILPSRCRCGWSAPLEMGDHAARQRLAELDPLIRADWRAPWYRGQCALRG